jgi:WD40 repeat protein/serine/threonine protein kinase
MHTNPTQPDAVSAGSSDSVPADRTHTMPTRAPSDASVVPPPPREPHPAELPAPPGYRVVRQVGRGGMGVVYEAVQLALKRTVALKFLPPDHTDRPDRLARFRVEGESAARLQHPGIVQVFETGLDGEQPFLAMEYVPGGSLADALNGTPVAPRQAAAWVEAIARAMAYAHSRGVVHRDLKPSNILLQGSGARGPGSAKTEVAGSSQAAEASGPTAAGEAIPKVTDFGLAKLLDTESGQTRSGAVMGTPSYMAPEQAAGNTRAVGPAADIWALGTVLYELLTGRPPFRGERPVATIQLVLTAEPVQPSELVPGLLLDLETVCLKCLRKEPERRYRTADELADDLRRVLDGRPVLARPVGPGERLVRWAARNPVLAGAVAAAFAVLVIGASVSTYFAVRESEQAAAAGRAADKERYARGEAEKRAKEAGEARDVAAQKEKEAVRAKDDLARKAAELEVQVYKSRVALAFQEWQQVDARSSQALLRDCPPALRGWEWNYVNRLSHLHEREFPPFKNSLAAIAVRPDGGAFALADVQGGVIVYDPVRARALAEFPPPKSFIPMIEHTRSVAYSPDGGLLASVLEPDTVVLRDGRDPSREVARLKDPKEQLERFAAVAFSPDGKTLATVGGQEGIVESYTLKLWSVTGRTMLKKLTGHTNSVRGVAFDPTGRLAATSGNDGRVIVWDLARGEKLRELTSSPGPVWVVAFAPDGRTLAAGCNDGAIRVWDAADGKPRHKLEGHAGPVRSIAFSDDDNGRLASASDDSNVKMWDPVAGRELFTLRGHQRAVNGIAFAPGGRTLLSAGKGKGVRVWDATRDRQRRTFADHPCALREGLYTPKGGRIALLSGHSSSNQPELHIYRADTGERQHVVSLKSEVCDWLPAVCMAASPDGTLLVTGLEHYQPLQQHGEVVVVEAATGAIRWRKSTGGHPVNTVAFSADGRHIGVGGQTLARIDILDAADGRPVRTFELPKPGAAAIAFSPDGRHLAATRAGGPVQLWRLDTGEPRHALPANVQTWYSLGRLLAFSPDGRVLAVACMNSEVVLYDVETGKELRRLKGHTAAVGCVAFSPDGRRLFSSAYEDRVVKVWDPVRGEDLFTVRGLAGGSSAVSVSPDGHRLLVTGTEYTAHEYDGTPVTK